jgi:hypothetical protein
MISFPCVNVLGRVSVDIKIICKITMSLGLLSPPNPYFRDIHKGNFIKSRKEMLKISISA